MIKKYLCPDGKTIKCEECIKKCRMKLRCCPATMPAHVFYSQREWTGKLSVTQALNPHVRNWMAIKQDGISKLEDNIYSMTGTVNHSLHEDAGKNAVGIETEIKLQDDLNYGCADQLEEVDGKYYLHDIKNKKTAQMYYLLDYEQIGEKKFASPSYKQTGSKLKDTDDVVLQLNRYRMLLEKERNIKISGLFMDVVLIDYSPMASPKRYGIRWQYFSVPVKILNDDFVMDYYIKADANIQNLLESDGPDKPCYECDDWKEFGAEGSFNRCNYYCSYKETCKKYFASKGIEHKGL